MNALTTQLPTTMSLLEDTPTRYHLWKHYRVPAEHDCLIAKCPDLDTAVAVATALWERGDDYFVYDTERNVVAWRFATDEYSREDK